MYIFLIFHDFCAKIFKINFIEAAAVRFHRFSAQEEPRRPIFIPSTIPSLDRFSNIFDEELSPPGKTFSDFAFVGRRLPMSSLFWEEYIPSSFF